MSVALLKRLLANPRTRNLDLDDPRTTHIRRQIIRESPFLRRLYEEWYETLAAVLPPGNAPVLELGSGGGFMEEVVPGLVTSEIFHCPYISVVLDGLRLPFRDGALRGIVMTNVLHHLPRPRDFFREASRCVRPGGVIAMVEPWSSPWSRWVYRHLHHEPFDPSVPAWEFPASGPLSGANGALPWIIFERDRHQFEQEFGDWQIAEVRPFLPFRYVLSGGVSCRCLVPACVNGPLAALERLVLRGRGANRWGMFAVIRLKRVSIAAAPG